MLLYREISRIVGFFLLIFAAAILIPLGVAAYYQYFASSLDHPQPHTTADFLLTFLVSLLLGAFLLFLGRHSKGILYQKEGIAAVVIIWFLIPALAAIPFLSSRTLENPLQAYFEMVSGLTTTGSTILHAKVYDEAGKEKPISYTVPGVHDITYTFNGTVSPIRDPHTDKVLKSGVEAIGKGLLFWRSYTQWLGGGGIVMLFISILPAMGMGGKLLFQSELSGPIKEGTKPRIKETAKQLWRIYIGLTLLQVLFLLFFNPQLPLFEAIVISFSTLSTGGFSTKNDSIAGYHSVATEWVVMAFMIVGSINFSLYYYLLKGKFYRLVEIEFLLFLALVGVLGGMTAYSIIGTPEISLMGIDKGVFSWYEGLRTGFFQLVSALTSTGFTTSGYDRWPYITQCLLLLAMFMGGMSGSTASGIKTIRLYMLFRIAQNSVESLFRPNHLRIFKMGKTEVDQSVAISVLCFFFIMITTATLGTMLYIYDGIDPETAFGLTACMVNDVGMSFRVANPEMSCAFLPNFSLLVSSVLMILGRLEYFVVLAVLAPAFWKHDT